LTELLQGNETLSAGPHREAFEAEFAEYLGVRHAVSTTSCTVALELATYLIGLQPGDVVIATPQTYWSSLNPLLDLDVEVRFCDIDPNSLNLDPRCLSPLICSRTRAIYLVHYGGLMADMDEILKIADQHGVLVLEDCAHAHGSAYHGKRAGTIGHIGCYSFQSMKNMCTLGEGGMITFNESKWLEVVRRIRDGEPDAKFVERASTNLGPYHRPKNLDRHEKNSYTHDCTQILRRGTNAVLSEPAAVVGRVQLKKLPSLIEQRRAIAARLNDAIANIDGLRSQQEPAGYFHSYHLYTFFVEPNSGIDHETLLTEIDAAGVEVQMRYFPLHLLPEWRLRGGAPEQCPIAERTWFEEQVNLPIYPALTAHQVDFMIDVLQQSVRRSRR
jgi:dTDP-4-amino-4,6-dideoxygalactose transaminase